jgi:uncharacterized membrane protein
MSIAIALHFLAAVIWVGGMFFAYMAQRPAAGELELGERLALWSRTFARFFPWVWVCVLTLLATGYWMIFAFFGGMKHVGLHVHLMQGLGILMMLIFFHVFFAPYRRLNKALVRGDLELGNKNLATIRKLIATNMSLGLIVVVVASAGRLLSGR